MPTGVNDNGTSPPADALGGIFIFSGRRAAKRTARPLLALFFLFFHVKRFFVVFFSQFPIYFQLFSYFLYFFPIFLYICTYARFRSAPAYRRRLTSSPFQFRHDP